MRVRVLLPVLRDAGRFAAVRGAARRTEAFALVLAMRSSRDRGMLAALRTGAQSSGNAGSFPRRAKTLKDTYISADAEFRSIQGMPRTLYDKIWQDHLVEEQPDGTCLIYIDRHLSHEVTSPQAFEGLRLSGRKVRAPEEKLC